jgi:putative endonuclease
MNAENKWLVYLLRCADGSYYCGCTNDLKKRVRLHNEGKGARYTRGRGPVIVLATREGLSKSQACKLELKVKKRARHLKIQALEQLPIA